MLQSARHWPAAVRERRGDSSCARRDYSRRMPRLRCSPQSSHHGRRPSDTLGTGTVVRARQRCTWPSRSTSYWLEDAPLGLDSEHRRLYWSVAEHQPAGDIRQAVRQWVHVFDVGASESSRVRSLDSMRSRLGTGPFLVDRVLPPPAGFIHHDLYVSLLSGPRSRGARASSAMLPPSVTAPPDLIRCAARRPVESTHASYGGASHRTGVCSAMPTMHAQR